MKKLMRSIRAYIVFSLLLGLAYPLLITFLAQVTMSDKANGSLIRRGGRIIGSRLIGQNFAGPGYFHGRPSANACDGANSGGANLGPSSQKLMSIAEERIKQVRRENGVPAGMPVPGDMVLASASGLDPHISRENAAFQAKRVSKIRNISSAEMDKLLAKNTDPDFLGLWGCSSVNVLGLNTDVDGLAAKISGRGKEQ